MLQTSTGPPQDYDRTTDSLDDLDRLLSNSDNFADFVTTPIDGSSHTPEAREAGPRLGRGEGTAPSASQQNKKQRALDKSREAQKRFRQRQRVRLETIQSQLDETTKQLRDLQIQQQQLQTRNILLEKVAQLSKEQTADDYLAWQNKQAELDFSCAHTEQTPQGFTLTLTIFGHKESKACRTVSKMSLTELAALWTEYMRKLGKCLLSLQQDRNGGARPLLNLWVAEAIALICCVRVYNPEFMKAIDSTAMNGSAAARPGHPLLVQHLELLQFTDAQLHDGLYLRRIAAARAAELARQRHAATQQLLSQSSSKQHPSDHLADSKASSEKLRLIGLEEYKLHGIVTDALFNGIFTSIQNAMGLVHMYPFLPDPLEYLELIAERQGQKDAPTANTANEADWQTLLAYCAKVTSVDICEHVPLSNFMPVLGQTNIAVSAAAAAVPSSSPVSQNPSLGQRSVHFSPDSATRQAVFQSTQSQNGNSDESPDNGQEPAWTQYSQVPEIAFSPMARQPSRQASSQVSRSMVPEHAIRRQASGQGTVPEHAMLRQGSQGMVPEHAMLRQGSHPGMVPDHAMLRQPSQGMLSEHAIPWQGSQQGMIPEHAMLRQASQQGMPGSMQYQLPFSQAAQHVPMQMVSPGVVPVHNPLFQMSPHSMHQGAMPVQDHMAMQAQLPVQVHQLPMQKQLSAPAPLGMQGSMPHSAAQQRLNPAQAHNVYQAQHPGASQEAAGNLAHSQPSGLLPPWIGQNLASAYAVPSSEAEPLTQRQPSLRPSTPQGHGVNPQGGQGVSPRAVYPTAAMRSQQLSSSQAPPVAISGNTVQAPLAPFLNEQLKRMLAQSNPSARRGF